MDFGSENDVILTARPRGCSVVYVKSCVGRLRWSPSLPWRAVFEVPRLQKPLGCECRRGTAVRVVRSSSHRKRRRTSAIVGHVPRKISAACSLFLADQLLARYFWQIRDRGIMSAACLRES